MRIFGEMKIIIEETKETKETKLPTKNTLLGRPAHLF